MSGAHGSAETSDPNRSASNEHMDQRLHDRIHRGVAHLGRAEQGIVVSTPPPESKAWASHANPYMQRGFNQRDHRPHSPCPDCYADCTSDDTGSILEFRCERGHVHHQARPVAIKHASWLARLPIEATRNA